MTPYERALIRLRAFKLLRGWGVASPIAGGMPTPWTLEQRMRYAAELADWATGVGSDRQDCGS